MISAVRNKLVNILNEMDEERILSEKSFKTSIDFNIQEIYNVWLRQIHRLEKENRVSLGLSDAQLKEHLKPHLRKVFNLGNIRRKLESPAAFGKEKNNFRIYKTGNVGFKIDLVQGAFYEKRKQVKQGKLTGRPVGTQKAINYVLAELYYEMGAEITGDSRFKQIAKGSAKKTMGSHTTKGSVVGHGSMKARPNQFQSTIASIKMGKGKDQALESVTDDIVDEFFGELVTKHSSSNIQALGNACRYIIKQFNEVLEREYHFGDIKDYDTLDMQREITVQAHYTDRTGNKELSHFDKDGIKRTINNVERQLRKNLKKHFMKNPGDWLKVKGSKSPQQHLKGAAAKIAVLDVLAHLKHSKNPNMRLSVNKKLANEKTKERSRKTTSTRRKGTAKRTGQRKINPKTIVVGSGYEVRAENIKKAQTNPVALRNLINSILPQEVAKRMDAPRLRFRTGRFANSTRVANATIGPRGGIAMDYTYMKYPYQTFEPGFKQGSTLRDPRVLIGGTIRELARDIVGKRYIRLNRV